MDRDSSEQIHRRVSKTRPKDSRELRDELHYLIDKMDEAIRISATIGPPIFGPDAANEDYYTVNLNEIAGLIVEYLQDFDQAHVINIRQGLAYSVAEKITGYPVPEQWHDEEYREETVEYDCLADSLADELADRIIPKEEDLEPDPGMSSDVQLMDITHWNPTNGILLAAYLTVLTGILVGAIIWILSGPS